MFYKPIKDNTIFLCLSDIHFVDKKYVMNWKNLKYDYLIYCGDFLRNGKFNDYIKNNIDEFINESSKYCKQAFYILGNNDNNNEFKTFILSKNSAKVNIITGIYNTSINDINIWFSVFSLKHTVSDNTYGQKSKFIPSKQTIDDNTIIVTHGRLPPEIISQATNKIYLCGHDHVDHYEDPNHPPNSPLVIENDNHIVNVSCYSIHNLNDRQVEPTYLYMNNGCPKLKIPEAYEYLIKI